MRSQLARPAIALFGSLLLLASVATSASGSSFTDASPEVLFSLTVGEDINYAGGGEQLSMWGPAAIAIGDDNTIWIADGAELRALGFTMSGKPIRSIDLSDSVVGIGDMEIAGDQLVVLDIAAEDPQVVVIDSKTGATVDKLPIPEDAGLAHGLSGVAVQTDGSVVAELEGGLALVMLGVPGGAAKAVDSYKTPSADLRLNGTGLGVPELGEESTVLINDQAVSLPVENYPGTVQLVGATESLVALSVDEITYTARGQILVDQTIRVFRPDGQQLGVARLPLADFVVAVAEPVAVSPGGVIIALVPRDDRLDVVALPRGPSVDTVLPATQLLITAEGYGDNNATAGIESCTSRSTMRATDAGYRYNSHYYSDTNINGTCSGRTKPRYFGSAGTYSSVSYKWGGWDTVIYFNSGMSPGTYKAGDITSGSTLSCARGVDCSGFVTRVWQRTDKKYGTSTLYQISTPLPNYSNLLEYDIFLKSGHVMLFRYYSGSGYYVSEATTASSYDRVIYRWISSSTVGSGTGYGAARYDNVCS